MGEEARGWTARRAEAGALPGGRRESKSDARKTNPGGKGGDDDEGAVDLDGKRSDPNRQKEISLPLCLVSDLKREKRKDRVTDEAVDPELGVIADSGFMGWRGGGEEERPSLRSWFDDLGAPPTT